MSTSATVCESAKKRRSPLAVLIGLLLFELIGWGALYFELDRHLGFGVRFWGIVLLALAACLIAWFSVRTLVARRGWFTLKEFLVFVLLVGCALGWAGHLHQQKREQRVIAAFLAERGSSVQWGVDDEPGLSRLIPAEYRHDITAVNADLTQLTAEDFAIFTRLPKLDGLQIYSFHSGGHGQRLTEDHLRHLRHVPALRYLSLDYAQIVAPALEVLRGHPHLQTLKLRSAAVENDSLLALPGIPHLRWLTLDSLQLNDQGMVAVGKCHSLEQLYLYQTAVTDAGLQHLTGLPRLDSLTIHGTAITDAGLIHVGRMEGLTSLDLSSTSVTDGGLQHLLPLKKLRTLVLHNTAVTADSARQLENELPNLRISRQ